MNEKHIPNKLWEDCLKLDWVIFKRDNVYKFNTDECTCLPRLIPHNTLLECSIELLDNIPDDYYNVVIIYGKTSKAVLESKY